MQHSKNGQTNTSKCGVISTRKYTKTKVYRLENKTVFSKKSHEYMALHDVPGLSVVITVHCWCDWSNMDYTLEFFCTLMLRPLTHWNLFRSIATSLSIRRAPTNSDLYSFIQKFKEVLLFRLDNFRWTVLLVKITWLHEGGAGLDANNSHFHSKN